MKILRNGNEYELTSDEIYEAHVEFVVGWMKNILQDPFGFSKEESEELALEAYDIYSDGKGFTEFESIEEVVERWNVRNMGRGV